MTGTASVAGSKRGGRDPLQGHHLAEHVGISHWITSFSSTILGSQVPTCTLVLTSASSHQGVEANAAITAVFIQQGLLGPTEYLC